MVTPLGEGCRRAWPVCELSDGRAPGPLNQTQTSSPPRVQSEVGRTADALLRRKGGVLREPILCLEDGNWMFLAAPLGGERFPFSPIFYAVQTGVVLR